MLAAPKGYAVIPATGRAEGMNAWHKLHDQRFQANRHAVTAETS